LTDSILIRGARVHNLKDITVAIPHDQMTVVTGVSGSGKSSLVFDTIYAEGQRRYVESLSAYARQFLERMEKPDVDEIDGIAPPVAIRQKNMVRTPRSTVGTSTEVYDFMRLLYARAGDTWCPECGKRVDRDTVDQVAAAMLAEPEGSRWYALFPIRQAAPKPGEQKPETQALRDQLFDLRRKGFNRLFQDGTTFEFSTPESLLDIDFSKPLFALVDRLSIGPDQHQRIVDTTEICYREAAEAIFEQAGEKAGEKAGAAPRRRLRFAESFTCKTCGMAFQEPEPRLFSFNNPFGACARCEGFGRTLDFDMDLVVPDPSRSLNDGAIDPWTKPSYEWYGEEFRRRKPKVRWDVPWADLTREERALVARAVREFFTAVATKSYKVHVRVFLSRYRGQTDCPDCGGARLKKEALYLRLGGRTIAEVSAMNIRQAHEFFETLKLRPEQQAVADKVLVEIQQRLRFLDDVGLDYLTLDRLSSTLSGGESQRIQLATCLGSRLVGACYVLDEPSIGLHTRDTTRLIRILHELRDLGNTIIVVEHDPAVMAAADHVIDIGPGAGENGGAVVFEGPYRKLTSKNGARSLTSRYLSGELVTWKPHKRRGINAGRKIRFLGARANNLKGFDVDVPLGMMVAVTGVSGSGKSTLVHEVIHKSLLQQQPNTGAQAEEGFGTVEKLTCRGVEGAHLVREVVLVDQSPIGRTPRSNPITYIKAFDIVRDLFASTPDAQRRGYAPGHFSFNVAGGRCETCQGDGTVTVEMQFLADVELVCEDCRGMRYKQAILDVKYRGLNVHEVLRLTVREAVTFFADVPRLLARLQVLVDVGLGYLRLGQSATTLSGGEAQRVKLAAHLGQSTSEGTLYIFDEPTTGLHFDDIAKLLAAFDRLIEQRGSILLIEHNLDVIRAADWVIDLGPEGGAGGGQLVVQGTPEQIAAAAGSHTGRCLRDA